MMPRLRSIFSAVSTLIVAGAVAGCATETGASSAGPPGSDNAEAVGMPIRERLAHFGVGEVRGVAYDNRPMQKGADDAAGFKGDEEFDKYRMFYDSDAAASELASLWGKGADGRGRDDLRRFKEDLHANFVTLYDWNAGARKGTTIPLRSHTEFLDHAQELGLKISVPLSNEQMKNFHAGKLDEATANIRRTMEEIYAGKTTPHPAVGMLKIFNEPDAKGIAEWPKDVSRAIAIIQAWEDEKGIPDASRLPIFSPVTDGITAGTRGGALLGEYRAIADEPGLGKEFWQKRMVIATNPFDTGRTMVSWAANELPGFERPLGMPEGTPIMFTEFGFSSEKLGDDLAAQGAYYKEQFETIYAAKDAGSRIFGAAAFVSQVRPYFVRPEPGFGIQDFGGDTGGWNLPAADHDVAVKYWNPNGAEGKGAIWDGVYHVQRQTPRPAYLSVKSAFASRGT